MNTIKEWMISIIISALGSGLFVLCQTVFNNITIDYKLLLPIFILCILSFWGGFYLRYKKLSPKLSKFKINTESKKRYSVLIVDDDFAVRKYNAYNSFINNLSEYDICLLSEISDSRLCVDYDILIIDVLNASKRQTSTHNILDSIRKEYPEKYVIVMSVDNYELDEQTDKGNANAVIVKPQINSNQDLQLWLKSIFTQLDIAFKDLDSPEEYWSKCKDLKKVQSLHEETLYNNYVARLKKHKAFSKIQQ